MSDERKSRSLTWLYPSRVAPLPAMPVGLERMRYDARPIEESEPTGRADSTAALIAAISRSITRRILPLRTRPGIARMRLSRSTSTHILASVCLSSTGSNSIPQRAGEMPIGPANAKQRGASRAVTHCIR